MRIERGRKERRGLILEVCTYIWRGGKNTCYIFNQKSTRSLHCPSAVQTHVLYVVILDSSCKPDRSQCHQDVKYFRTSPADLTGLG